LVAPIGFDPFALASSNRAFVAVTDVENEHGQLEPLTLAVDRDALAPAVRALDDRLAWLLDALLEPGFPCLLEGDAPRIRGVLPGRIAP